MTHWADKIVSNAEWAVVKDAFEKQFEALGSPRDMMLIAVEGLTPEINHGCESSGPPPLKE